jgi:hypothetical protein
MSIEVGLSELADAVTRYRFAYLLTSDGDARPRAVAVTPGIDGRSFVIDGIGQRSRNNLVARPDITLLWPPESITGYSLIVDGQATAYGDSVRVAPTRAVLHRPAPRPGPSAPGECGSDCVELALPNTSDPV